MKDSYLIDFSLFCKRTNFNIYHFLKNNKVTYEEFSDLMRKKIVSPPSEEFYNKIKNKILDDENKILDLKTKKEKKSKNTRSTSRRKRIKKSE